MRVWLREIMIFLHHRLSSTSKSVTVSYLFFGSLDNVYIATLIEWGIYWIPEHTALALSAIIPVSGLLFSYSVNQTKELIPETFPATRESLHQLEPELAE